MGQDLSASGGNQRPREPRALSGEGGWRRPWLLAHSPCLLRECPGHRLRSGHPQGTHEGGCFHGSSEGCFCHTVHSVRPGACVSPAGPFGDL